MPLEQTFEFLIRRRVCHNTLDTSTKWTTPIEPTNAEKKRSRFGTMFALHALLNRAGVDHENKHTLTCMGYIKSKDRF